ncbi:Transcription factor MYB46 [Zea mays]|uniref:Transcription factor MYB46 n=1 Tax=Zea mays TaxID=4577 RepID=A0A1D6IKP2_MAIZE|nr:Transcription factor MYB46 [Zea mays]
MARRTSGPKKKLRRGLWSPEEDDKLVNHIAKSREVWEELQAEVDQLPQAGPQEGSVLAGRGGPHHPSPFHDGQQVGGATVAGHAYSRSPARPVSFIY